MRRALAELEGVTLAAVLCHGAASAEAAAADVPLALVTRDRAAFLAAGLDAVDIVAPNHLHADLSVMVLEAGLHVLVEKPPATTRMRWSAMTSPSRGISSN